MQIFFATSACSKAVYEKIFNLRKKRILDPAQKFFEQLITGAANCNLASENEAEVLSISAKPVSASTADKYLFKKETEISENAKYLYIGFLNGKLSRFITVFFSSFFTALKLFSKKDKEKIVLCDPLYTHMSFAVRLAAKLCKVKAIAVVTDIPVFATEMKQSGKASLKYKLQHLYEYFSMKDIVKYDAYINLTESMDSIVNPKGKPSIVIEGSMDSKIVPVSLEKKGGIRTVVYAGGVYEKYGVKQLTEAFIKADLEKTELHIYGDGAYVDELKRISEVHKNVKYMGCVLNTDLPEIESRATLLVNPRFTNEEYTKFSFPSKTLEYMSSGTPVLSTRLKGIPEDYNDYLYWFDDESLDGMASKLREVFENSDSELERFGKKAQEFAVHNKSNLVQGERIIAFSKKIL